MARMIAYTGYGSLLQITPQTVNGIEQYIRWAETEVPSEIPRQMDKLVRVMATVNQAIARKMSFGPYDPREQDPGLAWRTPAQGIRRISQRYYVGWKVKRRGQAFYVLYNDSREAYYIEFGISMVGFGERTVPARRIRRPVRKLSQIQTHQFMMRTQAFHRIWIDVYANPQHKHQSGGFTQIVQSPAKGSYTGPNYGRYLP